MTSEYAGSLIAANYIKKKRDYSKLNKSYEAEVAFFRSVFYETLAQAYNPEFGDDKRKLLGSSLDEMLYYCQFNLINCDKENDFVWYYNYEFGNCFRFNSGVFKNGSKAPLKITSNGGSTIVNLFLVFLLGTPKNPYPTSVSTGLRVFIHNASFSPAIYEAVDAKTGTLTNIGVKRVFTQKSPQPYSDCMDMNSYESVYFKILTRHLNRTYRQIDCLELCLQRLILTKCGCYEVRFLRYDNETKPCLSEAELGCSNERVLNFANEDIKSVCLSSCPFECDSYDFDYVISTADFPAENYYNSVLKQSKEFYEKYFKNESMSYEKLKDRAVALNIYYPQLKYTHISETEKISIIDLVASIGGSFGLFLGKF